METKFEERIEKAESLNELGEILRDIDMSGISAKQQIVEKLIKKIIKKASHNPSELPRI